MNGSAVERGTSGAGPVVLGSVAAAALVVGVVVAPPAAESIALAGWAAAVIAAAVIDGRDARLPDRAVVPGIAFTIAAGALGGRGPGAVAGAVLLGLPMLAIHLARPAGLGFGDVKFGLLLGAGVGVVAPPLVLPAFVLSAAAHTGFCLVGRVRGGLVPFGPALAAGSLVIVSIGVWRLR